MQHHPTHQLHVEVTLAERALGRLAHRREGVGEDVVEFGSIGELLFVALPAQLAQPIFIVPTLSLISNSILFLALLRQLSPLGALCRLYRP